MNDIIQTIFKFLVIAFFITACVEQDVKINDKSSENLRPITVKKEKQRKVNREGEYLPGEILVRFKNGTKKNTVDALQKKFNLKTKRIVTPPNLFLMKILDGSSVKSVTGRLRNCKEIQYAEPNYIRTIH